MRELAANVSQKLPEKGKKQVKEGNSGRYRDRQEKADKKTVSQIFWWCYRYMVQRKSCRSLLTAHSSFHHLLSHLSNRKRSDQSYVTLLTVLQLTAFPLNCRRTTRTQSLLHLASRDILMTVWEQESVIDRTRRVSVKQITT